MKKRITIDGGAVVYQLEYPCARRSDPPRVRAAKQKATSAAQAMRNQILSTRALELLLSVNYPTPGSGLVLTLSFDDQHLPGDRKTALRRLKYFLQLLRKARRQAGKPEPRCVYCPEVLTAASGRWHFHLVLDSTGNDLDDVRRCWRYGHNIEARAIRVDEEENHETLARYMNKELREAQEYACRVGLHGWSCTRNCYRPEVDVQTVEDSSRLRAPRGATVLIFERRSTELSESTVLKYRLPEACFRRRRRTAKRGARRTPGRASRWRSRT